MQTNQHQEDEHVQRRMINRDRGRRANTGEAMTRASRGEPREPEPTAQEGLTHEPHLYDGEHAVPPHPGRSTEEVVAQHRA